MDFNSWLICRQLFLLFVLFSTPNFFSPHRTLDNDSDNKSETLLSLDTTEYRTSTWFFLWKLPWEEKIITSIVGFYIFSIAQIQKVLSSKIFHAENKCQTSALLRLQSYYMWFISSSKISERLKSWIFGFISFKTLPFKGRHTDIIHVFINTVTKLKIFRHQ